jgi:hypothetical protein
MQGLGSSDRWNLVFPAECEQERAVADRFDVVFVPSLEHEKSTVGQIDDPIFALSREPWQLQAQARSIQPRSTPTR